MDWRLDYSVRSKHGGRNNSPMYFVSLKVRDRGLLRTIEMVASIEELQDMLAKVCVSVIRWCNGGVMVTWCIHAFIIYYYHHYYYYYCCYICACACENIITHFLSFTYFVGLGLSMYLVYVVFLFYFILFQVKDAVKQVERVLNTADTA